MKLVVALAVVVIGVVALVAFAPATLVDSRVSEATGGRLRVAEAEGSVWQGRGVLADARGGVRLPVQWRLAPAPLLQGVADATIVLSGHDAPVRVRVDGDRVDVSKLDARVPASAFADASSVGGEVRIDSGDLVIDNEAALGNVAITWQRARLAFPGLPIVDLGTVSARLSVQGSALSGPITFRGADLAGAGTAGFDGRTVRIDVAVTPSPSAPPGVRTALASIGPPDAQGAVRLSTAHAIR